MTDIDVSVEHRRRTEYQTDIEKYRCVQQLFPCSMPLIKGVRFLLFNSRTTYIFYYIWLSSYILIRFPR